MHSDHDNCITDIHKMGMLASMSADTVELIREALLAAGPPDSVQALRCQVAAILGGSGGGKPGFFSGKGGTLERLPEAAALLASGSVVG